MQFPSTYLSKETLEEIDSTPNVSSVSRPFLKPTGWKKYQQIISYARVQFYTHRASNYCLISKTGYSLQLQNLLKNPDLVTISSLKCDLLADKI